MSKVTITVEDTTEKDIEQPCAPEDEIAANYSRRAVYQYENWEDLGLPAEYCVVTFTTYAMGEVVDHVGSPVRDAEWDDRNSLALYWATNETTPEEEYLVPYDHNVLDTFWSTAPDRNVDLEESWDREYDTGNEVLHFRSLAHLDRSLKRQCEEIDFSRDIDPTAGLV